MTEPTTTNAAQERLVAELLGWRQERPPAPPDLAAGLRSWIESQLAPLHEQLRALAATRRGRTVLISKSGLDRLACDGWWLDQVPYAHSTANVRGVLAHAAVAADVEQRRTADPPALVRRVWDREASRRPGDPASLSAWLNALPPEDAGALRDDVRDLLEAFREVWPPLPEVLDIEVERSHTARLLGGALTLHGVPDLVLTSRRRDDRARTLVVDLKTGRPRSEHDRHELRFYALLTLLASGRVPFRWSTFYVSEGRWESEDLRPEVLEATARRVVDGARQQVRLAEVTLDELREATTGPATTREDGGGLLLRGGGWCRFCNQADVCEVAAAVSQPPGMLAP